MTPSGYLLYGCGQLGVMALTRFFFQWLVTFAKNKPDASSVALFTAASVTALFLAFRIFDGLTDPIAGIASDRWVARGRQRRSLLWLSFLLPPVGMAMVFAPDATMSDDLRWILLASGMFVFFVGYTMYVIPYWSLVSDYSSGEPKTRAKLSNTLGVGVLVATGFGFVLSPFMVDSMGYFSAAVVWSIPCALLMVLPYYAAPKRSAPRPEPAAAAADAEQSLLQGFKLAFTHRRFLAVIVLFAGGQMSFTVMTAAAPFIAIDLLEGTKKDVAILLGPFLLTAVLGFLAVPRLAFRFGWERAVLWGTVLLGITYACSGLLGASLVLSPMLTAMLLFASAGPMASVLLGLEGEAITSSAAEQGTEVTSVYFGVYNFVVKSLNGVALLITGTLADAITTHGKIAVRSMGFSAGALLVSGVVIYLAVRPPKSTPKSATAG